MSGTGSILIAGGGIGGLGCALALANEGFDVQLFEQAPELREAGAGIQMGPNMVRALERLGVCDAVLSDAWLPRSLIMRDALDGSQVTAIPVTDGFREWFGTPYAVSHRGDLLHHILAACVQHPRIDVVAGRRVEDVVDNEREVTVRFADGGASTGAALVGADGMWSRVREHVIGDGAPRVSGHIAYRAVLPRQDVPEALWSPDVVLWAGPRTHLVHYPLRRGELYNLVAVFHSNRYAEGWDEYGDPEELWRHFSGQRPEVTTLLEKIETWKFWVLCDREPRRGWSRGRVTLLGDAAHPMLQYLAQGAAMALEDGLCLAQELRAAKHDVAGAFARYEDRRVVRTGRVQITARLYGELYHAAGVTAEVRRELLANRTKEQAWAGMSWLYGYAA